MRIDGYAPIRDYALIGDGRTVALVAKDGAIDWLCLPNIDSPSVFGAILDARHGGSFALQPAIPFESSRRYRPHTNVLETTFHTDRGDVRVVDAMLLPGQRLAPTRELVRSIEGVSGSVPMRWRFAPRFDYGSHAPHFDWRAGVPVALGGSEALAICHWNAGTPTCCDDAIEGAFDMAGDQRAMLTVACAHGEPLVLPGRRAVEARLEQTSRFWSGWTRGLRYDGAWSDAVHRSALVLKALIFAPSGASSAAATTSLPEEIGGERNWDYRFCWIRDSNFIIYALLTLGCLEEARSLFWWFMHATALTEPDLHVLYRLDGGVRAGEHELPLAGHRASRPVRVGNDAVHQTQLDIYGALLETAWLYHQAHYVLDHDIGQVLARIADHVCTIWRRPDSGIWEVRNGSFHFTHSKVMCWVALDRAARLADLGEFPSQHVDRWKREAGAIEAFVERECWSDHVHSYTRVAGSADVDASLLMLPLVGYGDPRGTRINRTIDAVGRALGRGELLYRYHAPDGLPGTEGCFLTCSFWMVGALVRAGRIAEASGLMEALVGRANDVGLFAEEIDPTSGDFLGNFPQALVHLSLINAARAISNARNPSTRTQP